VDNSVEFSYSGIRLKFESVSADDHILGIMQRSATFYETDVLERLRSVLHERHRSGAVVDAGAFFGTHAVFFSRICTLRPVIAVEANPIAFERLVSNIRANKAAVLPICVALGSRAGHATLIPGSPLNQGSARVAYSDVQNGDIVVRTLDSVVAELTEPIALLKIDVEGNEVEVLRGSSETIARHLPIICVEAHQWRGLIGTIRMLDNRYVVLDCLGYSPTYVLAQEVLSTPIRALINALWVARACLPEALRGTRWYLKRLAIFLRT